jgi:hypothetical protein
MTQLSIPGCEDFAVIPYEYQVRELDEGEWANEDVVSHFSVELDAIEDIAKKWEKKASKGLPVNAIPELSVLLITRKSTGKTWKVSTISNVVSYRRPQVVTIEEAK